MPSVYTIEGHRRRRGLGDGENCKRVRMGGKGNRGCTIALCKEGRRWKFQGGTKKC
jgi:hypothetical protein